VTAPSLGEAGELRLQQIRWTHLYENNTPYRARREKLGITLRGYGRLTFAKGEFAMHHVDLELVSSPSYYPSITHGALERFGSRDNLF
jgi:hypothetical protein